MRNAILKAGKVKRKRLHVAKSIEVVREFKNPSHLQKGINKIIHTFTYIYRAGFQSDLTCVNTSVRGFVQPHASVLEFGGRLRIGS